MADVAASVVGVILTRLMLKLHEIQALGGACIQLKSILERLGPVINSLNREELMLNKEYQDMLVMLNNALVNAEEVIDYIGEHKTKAKIQSGKYLQLLVDAMSDIDRWINRTQLISTGLAADTKIELAMLQKLVFSFHNELRTDLQQAKHEILNSVQNVPQEVIRLMREEQQAAQIKQAQTSFMPESAEKDMHNKLVQWLTSVVHIVPKKADMYATTFIEQGIGTKERLDRMLQKNWRLLADLSVDEMDADDIKNVLSTSFGGDDTDLKNSSSSSSSSSISVTKVTDIPVNHGGAGAKVVGSLSVSTSSAVKELYPGELDWMKQPAYSSSSYELPADLLHSTTSVSAIDDALHLKADSKIKFDESHHKATPFDEAEFEKMRHDGDIRGLLKVLCESSSVGQLEAAMALRFLADNPSNQELIAQSGGIPSLISVILHHHSEEAKAHSACVLGFMSRNNESRSHAIISAGGAAALATLLQNASSLADSKTYAAWAIGNMAQACPRYIDNIVESGCINQLIGVLRDGTITDANTQASWALRNIGSGGAKYQVAIVRAGAVAPLIQLLRDGRVETNTQAIWALQVLSTNGYKYVNIGEHGGIAPLLHLLHTGTADEQAQTAIVLSNLSLNPNSLVSMAAEGGIPMMLTLLRIGSEAGKMQAASALRHISLNNINQAAIGKAGGIPLLIQMLSSSSSHGKLEAAWTLYNLAADPHNRTLFNKDERAVLQYLANNAQGELQSTCAMLLDRVKIDDKKPSFFKRLVSKKDKK